MGFGYDVYLMILLFVELSITFITDLVRFDCGFWI